jgi:hypothetical protein
MAEDVCDRDASDPEPGKPHPRQSCSTRAKGAYLKLAESEDDPTQRLKTSQNQAAKKAKEYQPEVAPVEENNTDLAQEAEEPERIKSTSRKRIRPPDARDNCGGDEIHNGSIQTSRKRAKPAQRNISEPEEETTAVKKIKASRQASEKPVQNLGPSQVTLLTDKPTSKKRSREPGHEDARVDPVPEKPRKRMKPIPAEDKPATVTHGKEDIRASSTTADQGGGNTRKA